MHLYAFAVYTSVSLCHELVTTYVHTRFVIVDLAYLMSALTTAPDSLMQSKYLSIGLITQTRFGLP